MTTPKHLVPMPVSRVPPPSRAWRNTPWPDILRRAVELRASSRGNEDEGPTCVPVDPEKLGRSPRGVYCSVVRYIRKYGEKLHPGYEFTVRMAPVEKQTLIFLWAEPTASAPGGRRSTRS